MLIVDINEQLAEQGLEHPDFLALLPNADIYSCLLLQPKGAIAALDTGVCHLDPQLANKQYGAFLQVVTEQQPDIAVTPEYSLPWDTLLSVIKQDGKPAKGKLWILGCQSITAENLETAKSQVADKVTFIHETLGASGGKFTDPVVYLFSAKRQGQEQDQLVAVIQFKTHPMGDPENYERDRLQVGTKVYRFGKNEHVRLITLICSDAFAFTDAHAAAIYDRALIVHIQLNQQPRHSRYSSYRSKLFDYKEDFTEILCLNWAADVQEQCDGSTKEWKNIGGSAWYTKSKDFDDRDRILTGNHKRGLYYTWSKELHAHALFFNYQPGTYQLAASKVFHHAVPAALSKRRGPQVTEIRRWDEKGETWIAQDSIDDGFSSIIAHSGGAQKNLTKIAKRNPIELERVLALCAGAAQRQDWYVTKYVDSISIGSHEIVMRLTYCQDNDTGAANFREGRLIRCARVWNIVAAGNVPVAISDIVMGFEFEWDPAAPHQNAGAPGKPRATVVHMGSDVSLGLVDQTAKELDQYLHKSSRSIDDSRRARQRLVVWYVDEHGNLKHHEITTLARFDLSEEESPVDIARAE